MFSSLLHELGSGPASGASTLYSNCCKCVNLTMSLAAPAKLPANCVESASMLNFHDQRGQDTGICKAMPDLQFGIQIHVVLAKSMITHKTRTWLLLSSHSTPNHWWHMLVEEFHWKASAQACSCRRVCASADRLATAAAGSASMMGAEAVSTTRGNSAGKDIC